jgi:hypothetical protein
MDIDDACEPPTEMTPHEMHEYSDDIAARDRHCWVFPNGDDSFHLLLTDDSGGFIFADGIFDEERARWLAALVNAAMTAAKGRRRR